MNKSPADTVCLGINTKLTCIYLKYQGEERGYLRVREAYRDHHTFCWYADIADIGYVACSKDRAEELELHYRLYMEQAEQLEQAYRDALTVTGNTSLN